MDELNISRWWFTWLALALVAVSAFFLGADLGRERAYRFWEGVKTPNCISIPLAAKFSRIDVQTGIDLERSRIYERARMAKVKDDPGMQVAFKCRNQNWKGTFEYHGVKGFPCKNIKQELGPLLELWEMVN